MGWDTGLQQGRFLHITEQDLKTSEMDDTESPVF